MRSLILLFVVATLCSQFLCPVEAQPTRIFKSPLGIAVDPQTQTAYAALQTAGSVAVVDLKSGHLITEVPAGTGPHDVVLSGRNLFVTCEGDDTLVRINTETKAVSGKWKVGQAPRGLAALPDGSRVFVVCHDAKALCSVNPTDGKVETVALPDWPERVVLSKSGELLVLARPSEGASIHVIDPGTLRITGTEQLTGAGNPTGLAVSADAAATRLLTHQRPRTRVPATQIAQGWVFTNVLAAFGPGGRNQHVTTLDEPTRGYADPSDVVLLEDKRLAFVACGGADAVLAVRVDSFANPLPMGSYGPYGADREDLAMSRRYIQARLTTQSNPRRIALSGDGKTLVASNYLSDSLTVIDTESLRVVRHIPLGGPEPDAARRGEVLFHSNKMTFHGQFTCSSCHPNGGSDGLTWDLSRDGLGNFMNTRSLLGVRETAPYGWLASSPTLADRVSGTLRTLHHHEPQGTEATDIVAYLKTLSPPRPLPGGDPERIARGKVIFQEKGKCSNCHRRAALDDDAPHDVGTRVTGDTQDRFDTPSLLGVARTPPYLHHGQASTLEEIFSSYNPGRRHGAAHLLSEQEMSDLISYLKSL